MRRFASVAKEQIPAEQKFYKGAVAMTTRAYFARPLGHFKRHGKGLKATAPASHIQKPDTDNILKFIGDALSGLAYHDDCQIDDTKATKHWICDQNERVEVELTYTY